ncbi:acyltransferase family protein [uncultured Acinetobacter sp.]|uniref:acyltransferase family protein n=1 Tax=uncultured Acinetobacter sp. TaxID=165433 RepID=UPI0026161DD6|nr:acyltransferase family protein [uncultured Acinetobacter sp.]
MSVAYRADIDGLRAIAVLLVVFNHLGWSWFSGGYIGVDIFFVISGYLITSILIKQLTEQRFSIAHFYKKRVLRLAPAFFTVLATVSVLAWQVMLPDELIKYAQSALYGTFLMANLHMQNEVGDYFSQSVDTIPLLHLWSLGVEEQFYIFWPLILALVFKARLRRGLWVVIVGAILASLYYAQQQLQINAHKAYYSMPVRAFELLLGALIIFLPKIKLPQLLLRVLVSVCLVVIMVIATCFDQHTPFPGLMALIPCIATALMIYFGQFTKSHNPLLNHVLSLWIGKISYPLYLWHWPVIVFAGFYLLPNTLLTQLCILVITVLLAWITYRYIEQPTQRFAHAAPWRVIGVGFMLPALSVAGSAKMVEQYAGFPERFSYTVHAQLEALNSFAHRLRAECIGYPSAERFSSAETCRLGVDKAEVDFILIGDSHANSATGMFDLWAKDAGLRGYDVTQSSTLYLPQVERLARNGSTWQINTAFKRRNDAITAHLSQQHYPMVVLTGYYHAYLGQTLKLQDGVHQQRQAILYQGLKRAITHAEQASDQVILLLDVPELSNMSADCHMRAEILQRDMACSFSKANEAQVAAEFEQILIRLKSDFPHVKLIDPKDVLCKADLCQSSMDGIPIYRNKDDDHLSFQGAQAIGRAYLEKFGNPLQ